MIKISVTLKCKIQVFLNTIEIIDTLPGNTYKEFRASVPFPPTFNNPEFYHTLKCI